MHFHISSVLITIECRMHMNEKIVIKEKPTINLNPKEKEKKNHFNTNYFYSPKMI